MHTVIKLSLLGLTATFNSIKFKNMSGPPERFCKWGDRKKAMKKKKKANSIAFCLNYFFVCVKLYTSNSSH